MKTMRIAIIGASGHYPYVVDGATQRQGAQIVAIAPGTRGEDIGSLRAACERKGFAVKEYAWWEEMLEAGEIDIAAVNPWFCDSAQIAIACLKRGVHVYCEKPVATELRTLDELCEVYRAGSADFGAMFDGPHTSWLRTVKAAVDAGEIGTVRLMHGQKSYKMGRRSEVYWKRAAYGGMLPWIAIHPVSWFNHVLGAEPVWAGGLSDAGENRGHGELETTGCMLLRYPAGVIATIDADYYRPDGAPRHDDDHIRITGTRGMIEARDGKVFLENEQPRRELELLEEVNPFLAFADTIGTDEAKSFARAAFAATRTCLLARDAADESGTRWIPGEKL